MSKIITIEDMNNDLFYKVPKAFFHNPKYMFMKCDTKIAYSMLRDLLSLSVKNGWVNNMNQPFVRISREKLMVRLQCAKQKITEIMKELSDNELIYEKPVGQGKTKIIYICIPDDLNDVIYDEEELLDRITSQELAEIGISQKFENHTSGQSVDSHKTFENHTSKSLKIKRLKVRLSNAKKHENQTHNKNNINKTNLSDNNINKQQVQQEDVVVVDNDIKNTDITRIIELYVKCFGNRPTPAVVNDITSKLNLFDRESICHAIELAAVKGKGYDYVLGILKNWFKLGFKNIDDVVEYEFNTIN